MMQYRPVGRTGIELSVIGMGTAQLQMLPERQAIATLRRGFEMGINWVHSAPDYGGVEPWIARAIRESGREVFVAATGPGQMALFEPFFENTCTWFSRKSLDLYGINCIDDIERLGENAWGRDGMIEFLLRKKAEGRLRAVFCTTHGRADYVSTLVTSGVFDAVMLAYNPLGFHLLSYFAEPEGRRFEDIAENREHIFPLAVEHGVSLLVMKPLAGGLLCRGKAFPPHEWMAAPHAPLAAVDVLKYILAQPGVTAVVPGVASVEEAEEDAGAGYAPLALPRERMDTLARAASAMRTSLCSRCGACERTCSRGLRISSMLRDAYIWNYGNETFMADERDNYFRLNGDTAAACATCVDRTCECPEQIDIPVALGRAHRAVHGLRSAGRHPGVPDAVPATPISGPHQVIVLTSDVQQRVYASANAAARFMVQNAGAEMWTAYSHIPDTRVAVAVGVILDGRLSERVPIRQNVCAGARSILALEFRAPAKVGACTVRFALMPLAGGKRSEWTEFYSATIDVAPAVITRQQTTDRLWRFARRASKGALRRVRTVRRAALSPPAVSYTSHTIPHRINAGETCGVAVTLRNVGPRPWRRDGPHPVEACVFVDDRVFATCPLPVEEVASGNEVMLHFALRLDSEGAHTVRVDVAERNVVWLSACGSRPLTVTVHVERGAGGVTETASRRALRHNIWHYLPTLGIQRARDGRAFPLFIERAQGCRLWDTSGREYLDYTMGWGSTILGHAHATVQQAIRDVLDTSPLTPFPHPIEMEVSEMLAQDFASGEMVVFGKNGSDVCTVAARIARLVTGRQVILSCGFHGWQDFALDMFAFRDSGIPERTSRVLHKFRFNDRRDFFRLFDEHRKDLAAVMIEPAGPFRTLEEGPGGDADPEFLATLADAARGAGALLIFDEIITGYRYPLASVQRATGITPDLTCLGKALASGMPLSALVGRASMFHSAFSRTHYCPTFKAEVYSLAAARAAIALYRREPIASHIWTYGETLRERLNAACARAGAHAECRGPAFRMAVIFEEPDPYRARLKRTLYVQELLKEGIVTVTGVMLPSYAHDAAVLEQTVSAVERAVRTVAESDREGRLEHALEIPLL